MTTTEPRSRGAATGTPQSAGLLTAQPQVNLLPPEVRTARGLKSTKRLLGIVLVGVVLLCGAGYVLASTVEQSAQDRLAEADSTTADPQAEAQQYAELPRVRDEIDRVTTLRAYGMGPDIEWTPYIGAVAVLLPPDARIEAFTMTLGNPVEAPTEASDPLQPADSVGRFELVARTTVLPDAAAWMDSLGQVPGFSDARVSSAQTAEADGSTFYRVTVSVQVMPAAYSGRFDLGTEQEEG
jgi:Tfp pilus assembly protein PilN